MEVGHLDDKLGATFVNFTTSIFLVATEDHVCLIRVGLRPGCSNRSNSCHLMPASFFVFFVPSNGCQQGGCQGGGAGDCEEMKKQPQQAFNYIPLADPNKEASSQSLQVDL